MKAEAYSNWTGTWKEGSGSISTKSPTVKQQQFSYASRFHGAPGGSPEELLAAAHAGCFNQALTFRRRNHNEGGDRIDSE